MILQKANVFFIPGSITLLAGKLEIGKTNIAFALTKAFVTGQNFS